MSFTYSILLKIAGANSVAAATSQVSQLDSAVNRIPKSTQNAGRGFSNMGKEGQQAVGGINSGISTLLTRLGLVAGATKSLQTAAQFEGLDQAITFASGSAEEGERNIAFLDSTIQRLGLNAQASYQGFKLFQGGLIGTNITAKQSREIFESVAIAGTTMRLSAQDQEGVFLALSQIMGKGKVQAEELRGQIGERIPGAFGIAARAMGVTTAELNNMLDRGELMSEDFLPKFAAELRNTFGGGVEQAAQGATANFNRAGNSLVRLAEIVGTQLMPPFISFTENALIPAADWIGRNIKLVTMLGIVIGGFTTTMKVATITTGGLRAATIALNLAMRANPIGFVIGLLATLTGAVIYAWNNFAKFRGFLTGMWEAIKVFGNLVREWMIDPLLIFGKLITGVFTFNRKMIAEGIKDATSFATNSIGKAGERLGNAFTGGYEKGVASLKTTKAGNLQMAPGGIPIPGADAVTNAFQGGPLAPKPAGGDMGDKIKNGITSIAEGGKSTKNINISLGKLVETIRIEAQTVGQGADDLAEIVLRKLVQVLNSANQVQ